MSTPLPQASPESVGLPSTAILRLIDAVESRGLDLHSLIILRHGSVAAKGWWSPYDEDDVHLLYSLSKSFTSTAVGLVIEEGRLSLDDAVISFFPESLPAHPSENLRSMTVRHLLTMSTGQGADDLTAFYDSPDGDWIKRFLDRPVPYRPGTRFLYNSGATYALSAILTRLTGKTVLDYLRPRLLEPLGIGKATWEADPRGISVGGWGLSVTTDAIARFGQLYLQEGRWNDRQVVPRDWIRAATAFQIENDGGPESDWGQGYGFQFWRCRHDAYRGDGAFGQFCVVVPHQALVVAVTASVSDMQAVLNLLWDTLLPAASPTPLPEDPGKAAELSQRMRSLVAAGPIGDETSPTAARVSGRSYVSDSGESLECVFAETSTLLVLRTDTSEHRLEIGRQGWKTGQSGLLGMPVRKAAARGVWTASDIYVAEVRFVESPEVVTITLTFTDDRVSLKSLARGRFGAPEGKSFTGHRRSS